MAQLMEMYVLNEDVALLEAELPPLQGEARLDTLKLLAWHLRQRNTPRAVALADEAGILLSQVTHSPDAQQITLARLQLVHGEATWLYAQLDAAQALADIALTTFETRRDAIGCADAHWLRAMIAADRGDLQCCNTELDSSVAHARRANDRVREDIAEATLAQFAVFRDLREAEARWGTRFNTNTKGQHPAVTACISDFFALLARQSGDFGGAITYFMQTQELSFETGQIRNSIGAATNTGNSFSDLNDHYTALEWMQVGLDLARAAGWSPRIGACLMQTGETLRLLGQLDSAQKLLHEALQKLTPLAGSRNYAITLNYLSNLELDQGRYAAALDSFRRLQQRGDALNQTDFQIDSLRGQAHALSYLGEPELALTAANLALRMANEQDDPTIQIAALKVLADIHTRHTLPHPADMTATSAPLHYLLQALDLGTNIEGYTIPGDLLDALGREYARVNDYPEAYKISLQAITSREKTQDQDATSRAIAMQVRHQTEHARSESEHHRQLAQAEAKRAEVLQQTSTALESLSAIGQEITAHMDASAVFQTLNRHVRDLLDARSFLIYLTAPDNLSLYCAFGIEAEQAVPPNTVLLSSTSSYSARCVRERCEILINKTPEDELPNLIPGTLSCLSKLFAPLMIGERILGVMTIQSPQQQAYAERDRLIFRSLCAYGAIALDNANAYQQLQQAQTQLMAQEKLAALGSLVAGVAHELNTPIGNSLIMASALQEKTAAMNRKMEQQSLLLADLTGFIDDAREASVLIMRGLTSSANLVNSFKQVAVDRTTAQRRVFDLQQTSNEIIATMMSQIRPTGHTIDIDIPPNIAMHSYPGPFGQVLTNFINNALLHAFEGRTQGKMLLSASKEIVGRIQLTFCDDGVGISEQNLKRIFDPFFTTKMGQGGNGLGLSISDTIVTSLLNGRIAVKSTLGAGTRFTLDLPLATPAPD
jgi:signal transduction histidine kinase